jgi:glycosyltransferase involved in cell wall biosynthesis
MTVGAPPGGAIDVLIVSLGSTEGLRRADEELRDSLARAGARAQIVRARPPAPKRTLMLTDLGWARAARAAALRALADLGRTPSPAIVYSSTTAALLWPRPGAIRFDAPSAGNRPGRHGLWQRPLERRRLEQAPLLVPWSAGALREARVGAEASERAIVLPVPVEPSGALSSWAERDIAAITYAANPAKKGLVRVLAAWRAVHEQLPADGPRELLVTGLTQTELHRVAAEPRSESGVRAVGMLPAERYRALLRRTRVFVCAPTREDYGIAQLEALAEGCALVTTSAPGPYAALPIARALDGRLVSEDLGQALLLALLEPGEDYPGRALQALAPFRREASDRVAAGELLTRLRSQRGAETETTTAEMR